MQEPNRGPDYASSTFKAAPHEHWALLRRLSPDELLAMCFLLLVAGHETTVNLIGNGVLALLEHPDQMARLREQPELIATPVEEMLRYGSPLQFATERYASADVEIAGLKSRAVHWFTSCWPPRTATRRASPMRSASTSARFRPPSRCSAGVPPAFRVPA